MKSKNISLFQQFGVLAIAISGSLAAGGVAAQASAANPAGEIEYSRGAAAAQKAGQPQRLIGPGAKIEAGETLSTSADSFAILKLNDGTKMTLRPNTTMRIDEFVVNDATKPDSGVFNLLRGGLRVVTGLINKRNPNAARVTTATATVGIRGTDFDVRLCGSECAAENRRLAQAGRRAEPNAPQASARVAVTTTAITALQADGVRRAVVQGGAVYPGDTLETAMQGHAVLVFRDDTKVTVQSGTRFRVEEFVYDKANPGAGAVSFNLLKGGIRALTGLIAKAQPRNVRVSTPTATVGIRGTGFDLVCEGRCAGEAALAAARRDCMLVSTWQGETQVQENGGDGSTGMPVQTGQTACQDPGMSPSLLAAQPDFMRDNPAPRPDTVNASADTFFAQTDIEVDAGLFVTVRDGHVNVATSGGSSVDLGRGETSFVNVTGTLISRPNLTPIFLDADPTPRPDQPIRLLGGDTGVTVRPAQVCRR